MIKHLVLKGAQQVCFPVFPYSKFFLQSTDAKPPGTERVNMHAKTYTNYGSLQNMCCVNMHTRLSDINSLSVQLLQILGNCYPPEPGKEKTSYGTMQQVMNTWMYHGIEPKDRNPGVTWLIIARTVIMSDSNPVSTKKHVCNKYSTLSVTLVAHSDRLLFARPFMFSSRLQCCSTLVFLSLTFPCSIDFYKNAICFTVAKILSLLLHL